MTYMDKYNQWLSIPGLDHNLKEELEMIKGEVREIEARFYKELEFGTGGLRGILGAGSNRLNIYTVRKTTQGLANYLKQKGGEKELSVAIGYDSRRMSKEFATEAGLVLAQNGVKAYVFSEIAATPILSFAVRELKASGGIVITASHNPPEYNGYKVYGECGGQVTDEAANNIIDEISKVDNELEIAAMELDEAVKAGLFQYIGDEILTKYNRKLKNLSLNPHIVTEYSDGFRVVYTPLHGTGGKPVVRILKDMGFSHVYLVPEQSEGNGEFPTVKYPNPEEQDAFELAIKLGKDVDADILMATDPDADRLGVAVKDKDGEYFFVTGNQLGALMLDYILSQKKEHGTLPEQGMVIKTVVTSEIGRDIAKYYGLEAIDTLTGFKYICEKIKEFYEQGGKKFLFGYEESYGYLIGDFVRDKDAIQACQIAAEMTLFYKTQGLTLSEKLEDIFKRLGYYKEDLTSFVLEGKEGQEQIKRILDTFRSEGLKEVNGKKIDLAIDYLKQEEISLREDTVTSTNLPAANVLKYILEDDSWFCIRPSGTEPKIKIYFGVREKSEDSATKKLAELKGSFIKMLESN
ncbi:phosphoglucomutase [Desulfitispora alkaliphila]|uniref:phospho-sugar mutase n=1 Tax=Desulfitispora alkaliphila TaxID=622674 RepID=UPI003D1F99FE